MLGKDVPTLAPNIYNNKILKCLKFSKKIATLHKWNYGVQGQSPNFFLPLPYDLQKHFTNKNKRKGYETIMNIVVLEAGSK